MNGNARAEEWREAYAEQERQLRSDDMQRMDAIGGGYAYVGHGSDCVLLCLTDVGWWKNAVGFSPDSARRLGMRLIEQADAAGVSHGE